MFGSFSKPFFAPKIYLESKKKLKIWKTENCRYKDKVQKHRSKKCSKTSKTLKNGWFSTKLIGTTLLFWDFSLCFEWTLNWHLSFSRFSEKNQMQGQSLKKVDFSRKNLKNRDDTVKKNFSKIHTWDVGKIFFLLIIQKTSPTEFIV